MHMFSTIGLRGAIAFALAIRSAADSLYKVMFTTTLLIVITSVILCGGLSTQMLQMLKIRLVKTIIGVICSNGDTLGRIRFCTQSI